MTLLRWLPAVALALVLLAPGAAAHANYLRSEPARGARLAEAPAEVAVTLSEAVDPGGVSLVVRDADDGRVDNDDLRVQGGETPRLAVTLRDGVGPGAYVATWRALSTVDGHVTTGSFGFAVGAFEPPTTVDDADGPTPFVPAAARTLLYVGFALGLGAVASALFVETAPRAAGRAKALGHAVVGGAAFQLAGVAVLFLATRQGAELSLGAFTGTEVGRTLGLRVALAFVGLGVALRAARRSFAGAFDVSALAGLFLLGAWGSSSLGHVSLRGAWAVALDWLHLVAAAVWLGGLGLFLHFVATAPARGDTMETVRRVGFRFSRLALASVIVLGLTGVVTALLILGFDAWRDPLALLASDYGWFLGGKIALFVGMVGLAAVNRFVFLGERPGPDSAAPGYGPEVTAPAQTRGAHARTHRFARVVAIEVVLGLSVLVLAGFLTAVSPPYAGGAAGDPDAFTATGFGEHFDVLLAASPAPVAGAGSNVTLTVRTSDGEPLTEAIRVRAEIRGEGQAGSNYTSTHEGDGVWRLGDVFFATGGAYVALVTIQTEEVFREVVEVRFQVA